MYCVNWSPTEYGLTKQLRYCLINEEEILIYDHDRTFAYGWRNG